jgi:arylsulfatase A-like enzyme
MPAARPATWGGRLALCAIAVTAVGLAGARWSTLRDWLRAPPNVVVVVLDSVRADRVDLDGRGTGPTPFLAELAATSTVYERAYVPSSWTVPVVASLMTGQYPSQHRVTNFLSPLDEATPTLAELLAERGYATTAVSANPSIRPVNGFARGFERYQIVGEPTMLNPKSDGWLVIDKALRWLDEVGTGRPHFLYLHFMDAHMPYRAHEGFTPAAANDRPDDALNLALVRAEWEFSGEEVRRLEELYDGEVRYEDALLRQLFTELAARGLLDHALVAVLADHGEEFGRHTVFGHGASLHEQAMHVPLLIRFPGQGPGRVRDEVQVAGLTASILAAAGVRRPASVRIDPIPLPGAVPPAAVFSELVESGIKQRWLHTQAVVSHGAKMLVAPDGRRAFYDLARDPFERSPRAPGNDALEVALAAHLADVQPGPPRPQVTVDGSTRERLRAVGYLRE